MNSRTAAVDEPYLDPPGEMGLLWYAAGGAGARSSASVSTAGFQVGIHAQGERGIRMSLAALAPVDPGRQSPAPPDRARRLLRARAARDRGSPEHPRRQPARVLRAARRRLPRGLRDARTEALYPYASLRDAGILVAGSSDAPVIGASPLIGMRDAVLRRTDGGATIGAGEALPPAEALAMYTGRAAFVSHHEARVGSLEPGKLADFVVLAGIRWPSRRRRSATSSSSGRSSGASRPMSARQPDMREETRRVPQRGHAGRRLAPPAGRRRPLPRRRPGAGLAGPRRREGLRALAQGRSARRASASWSSTTAATARATASGAGSSPTGWSRTSSTPSPTSRPAPRSTADRIGAFGMGGDRRRQRHPRRRPRPTGSGPSPSSPSWPTGPSGSSGCAASTSGSSTRSGSPRTPGATSSPATARWSTRARTSWSARRSGPATRARRTWTPRWSRRFHLHSAAALMRYRPIDVVDHLAPGRCS